MNSDEYEVLCKMFAALDLKMTTLNTKLDALETKMALLQGQFNKKLTGIKREESASEDLYQGQLIKGI